MKSPHPAAPAGLELPLGRAGYLEALDLVGQGHRADQVHQVLDLDRQGHRVERAQGACLEVGLVRQVARLARQVVRLAQAGCPAEVPDRLAERGQVVGNVLEDCLVGPRFLRGVRGAGNDAAVLLPMMNMNTMTKKKSLCVQAADLGVGLVYRLVQVACPEVERAQEACLEVDLDRPVARLARRVVRLAQVGCPAEAPHRPAVRVAYQAPGLDRPVVLAGYQAEGHAPVDCLALAHVPVVLAMRMKRKKRARCAQAVCRLVAHVPVECPVRAPDHQHDQVDYLVHPVAHVLAGCLELGQDRLAVPAAYLVQVPRRRHVRGGYLARGQDRPHVLAAYRVPNPVHLLDQAGCQARDLVLPYARAACLAQDPGHRHDPVQHLVRGPARQHVLAACPARGLDRPLAQEVCLEPSPARQHDRVAYQAQVLGRLLDPVDSPAWQGVLARQAVRLA